MMQKVRVADLPEDLQILLQDVVSAAEDDGMLDRLWTHHFRIRKRSLSAFPRRLRFGDYRGKEYALAMVGQELPPIVVCGASLLDGKHRVWARRRERQKYIAAIDLSEIGFGTDKRGGKSSPRSTGFRERRVSASRF